MMKLSKNIQHIVLLFLFMLLIVPFCYAKKDITFTLNQSEYYFLINEDAVIPLEIENTYGKQINGMLSYTIIQEINQGGFHYSSSNTNSKSLTAQQGKNTLSLDFGTSDNPSTLKVGLSFNYNDGKDQKIVELGDVMIHFVSDNSQKKNKQNKVQSSSEKVSQQNQQNQQQQDPFSQQMKQMQDEMNKMFGNQQQNTAQNTQQKLQNNQMAQDSNVLKQQMQKQLQEQQKMKQEFQKQLAKNQKFQKQHQALLNKGYNLTDASLNPSTNNTGTFEMKYKKKDRETASLKGEMKDSKITDIQKFDASDKKKLLEQLNKNKQYQKFQQQLQKQGFNQKDNEFSQEGNKTYLQQNYQDDKNQTAVIKAEFNNDNITKVELEKPDKEKSYLWLWLLIILLAVLSGYSIYKKYFKKQMQEEVDEEKQVIEEKPFDYLSESKKLLEQAKKLFEKKKYKDAYGKAGQALRLYLSYKNNLKKELTNDDVINHLKKHNKPYKEIKECFELCSLVEFAKYQANKKDFDKIVSIAGKMIR